MRVQIYLNITLGKERIMFFSIPSSRQRKLENICQANELRLNIRV